MSTRGAIGRLTHLDPVQFRAVYHHWDSYPTGLGKTLWDLYHGHFQGDLDALLQVLMDEHPAGWSSINNADFTVPVGYNEEAGSEAGSEPESRGGPRCYCHGDRHEAAWEVTAANAAASGCEYAYVFTTHQTPQVNSAAADNSQDSHSNDNGTGPSNGRPENRMLVLASYSPGGQKMIGMFGMGDPEAVWEIIATIALDGPEPDWEQIEAQARLGQARVRLK